MILPKNTKVLVTDLLRGDTEHLKDREDIDKSNDDDGNVTEEEVEETKTDDEVEQLSDVVLPALGGAARCSVALCW